MCAGEDVQRRSFGRFVIGGALFVYNSYSIVEEITAWFFFFFEAIVTKEELGMTSGPVRRAFYSSTSTHVAM